MVLESQLSLSTGGGGGGVVSGIFILVVAGRGNSLCAYAQEGQNAKAS